ncbi:hypothetical protein J5E75_04720, partial [Streptococcus pneumoniae]|uniref:hypothetical protein n=1 Tax=Streptococcus pneumoniae TaxID=1313 RepID=UPI001C635DBA
AVLEYGKVKLTWFEEIFEELMESIVFDTEEEFSLLIILCRKQESSTLFITVYISTSLMINRDLK